MLIRPAVPDDSAAVDALLAARTVVDGRAALTEFKTAARRDERAVELVATEGRGVAGYVIAALHGGESFGLELATDPEFDEEEVAVALISHVATVLPEGTTGFLWAWRGTDRTAAQQLGLHRARLLVTMERQLSADDRAHWSPPDDVELVRFRRGVHEDRWLDANRMAFAEHPETGAIDRADLERRLDEAWFDPDGFLLACDPAGDILGYCWTKLHPHGVGEIYIIGVVPTARHRGLGAFLLNSGLADLAGRQGATTALLYVDGEDADLRSFYEQRGFTRSFETAAFALEAQPNR